MLRTSFLQKNVARFSIWEQIKNGSSLWNSFGPDAPRTQHHWTIVSNGNITSGSSLPIKNSQPKFLDGRQTEGEFTLCVVRRIRLNRIGLGKKPGDRLTKESRTTNTLGKPGAIDMLMAWDKTLNSNLWTQRGPETIGFQRRRI